MPLTENIHLLTPEFALAGLALLVFVVDLLLPEHRKNVLPWLSILGLIGVIALSLKMLWGQTESLYGGLLAVDAYSLFFKVFFLGLGIFIILISFNFVKQFLEHTGEFYGLLLFSILGMNLMAQSRELLTAYISLELLSFSLYVMVAYALRNPKSNEASIKYIIIGAFSSAILLYGISMVYSTLGVTQFAAISDALGDPSQVGPALWVGLALIIVGLGFKLAAVPFHMWAPDTYEGAPLPVTAYLAIGSKAAAFALLLRFVAEGLVPTADRWSEWQIIVAVLAAFTMLLGNLVALAQRNIKRLMAYSSIAHVGFVLAGIAALAPDSLLAANGIMLYLVGYAVTNLMVFAALIAFFNSTGHEEIADFGGLADRQPLLAAAIAMGFFSLGGLPIFAGFTIKFYLFTAVAAGGFLWLAGLAIFSSLVSLYYYLNVIRQMYIEPAPPSAGPVEAEVSPVETTASEGNPVTNPAVLRFPSLPLAAVIGISFLAVVAIGIYPAPLLEVVEAASRAILPGG
ncbi:MAG: NADH-quinone oxidoreductase subunit N [Chloroflexi bacterium]|nr:NADH-quinone oxidoreductase subunit N [Chloroflexota bacterium]